jgi:hypothetical protein
MSAANLAMPEKPKLMAKLIDVMRLGSVSSTYMKDPKSQARVARMDYASPSPTRSRRPG